MKTSKLFGVEIELEDCEFDEDHANDVVADAGYNWHVDHDGTLRDGGIELVSNGIQSQKELLVIEDMLDELGVGSGNVTFRTSSHVHINTKGLTQAKRFKLLILLIAYDKEFFRIHGEGRDKSPFCSPASSPISMHYIFNCVLSESRSLDLKYASVNPMPLRGTGSIELRHFHPFIKNRQLKSVTDLILELYKQASDETSVHDMIENDKYIPDVLKRILYRYDIYSEDKKKKKKTKVPIIHGPAHDDMHVSVPVPSIDDIDRVAETLRSADVRLSAEDSVSRAHAALRRASENRILQQPDRGNE